MKSLEEKINIRFEELIVDGKRFLNNIPRDKNGRQWHRVPDPKIPIYEHWLYSVCNLIQAVVLEKSQYYDETVRLLNDTGMSTGIPTHVIRKMLGLLKSTKEEWNNELIQKIEYVFAAETFDDFLERSASYHKAGEKIVSSVLASAVLEDVLKKIAKKSIIDSKDKSIEPLVNDLVKEGVFTSVKAKRIKAYAGTRKHAFHAEWDDFDLEDVGEMIKGIRELIDNYL